METLSSANILLVILVMTLATFTCRSMPFFTLKKVANHPIVLFIGKNLPPMIMMLLLMYCFADVDFTAHPFGIKHIFSTFICIMLYLLSRNALVAISLSTALYMVLVQTDLMETYFF